MEPIDYQAYFDLVMKGFAHVKPLENETMTILSEDIFKMRWLSRVRFNSFITYSEELELGPMAAYVNACLQLSRKGRSKLGEPIVCNIVAICEKASDDVIRFAEKRPSKHTTMDEFPIVIDLSTGEAHYYTGAIFYGFIYEKFEREYIDGHFALPLRALREGLVK